MSYDVAGSKAFINGSTGQYGNVKKGINYGKNAAVNHLGYIKDFEIKSEPLNPDIFTKGHTPEEMYNEVVTKCKEDKMPPIDFLLQYAPKMGAVKGFFSRLFKGTAVDKKALIGFTYEAMGEKKAITLEEADKGLNAAFGDITNAKLSAKAFDVNNDGMIDVSEEAVSTVLADVLSKENTDVSNVSKALKKADGSYTNQGENKMTAFLNEENYDAASKTIKKIHKKMKLDKAMKTLDA